MLLRKNDVTTLVKLKPHHLTNVATGAFGAAKPALQLRQLLASLQARSEENRRAQTIAARSKVGGPSAPLDRSCKHGRPLSSQLARCLALARCCSYDVEFDF